MKNILLIFFFLNFFNNLYASTKTEIIKNFEKIDNITFNFEQKINEDTEEGNCIIKYPKKIYCSYNNLKKKIIVSNGKSLVIKNTLGKEYFLYPLKQTALNYILDKDFLLDKIKKSKIKLIDDKYFIFSINDNKNIINVFFDKKSYDLIGWQTEDIYQNLVVTFIYNIKKNINVDEKLFRLPKLN